MKGKRIAAIAAVGAAFAVVVGLATGAIPGAGGEIQGCYLKVGGVLRVIDAEKGQRCTRLETPLNWSQQGPQGAAGAPGERGPQGPPGPTGEPGGSGPSDLYVAFLEAPVQITATDYETQAVLGLDLPAGDYLVSYQVLAEENRPGPCFVEPDGGSHDFDVVDGFDLTPVKAVGKVEIICRGSGRTGNPTLYEITKAKLMALAVTTHTDEQAE